MRNASPAEALLQREGGKNDSQVCDHSLILLGCLFTNPCDETNLSPYTIDNCHPSCRFGTKVSASASGYDRCRELICKVLEGEEYA